MRIDLPGLESFDFTNVTADSRAVRKGSLFVCVAGTSKDGHDFLDEAFAKGALAAVVSDPSKLRGRAGLVVADCRIALSHLAARFAGNPSDSMKVVAITGTNGKTTTNWLVHYALNKLNSKSIRIGTIGVVADGIIDLPGLLTTPDPIFLH